MRISFSILLLFLLISSARAQNPTLHMADSWTMLGVKAPIGNKFTAGYNHIFLRQENFYGRHNRMFGDWTLSYKVNSNWSLMYLNRFVMINGEGNDAFWIFLDVNYTNKKPEDKFWMKLRMRAHLGTEWTNGIDQADFLRPSVFLYLKSNDKLTLFTSVEPFVRFAEPDGIQRVRYELGALFKLSPDLSGVFIYRMEDINLVEPNLLIHFIVAGLTYKLNFKKK